VRKLASYETNRGPKARNRGAFLLCILTGLGDRSLDAQYRYWTATNAVVAGTDLGKITRSFEVQYGRDSLEDPYMKLSNQELVATKACSSHQDFPIVRDRSSASLIVFIHCFTSSIFRLFPSVHTPNSKIRPDTNRVCYGVSVS